MQVRMMGRARLHMWAHHACMHACLIDWASVCTHTSMTLSLLAHFVDAEVSRKTWKPPASRRSSAASRVPREGGGAQVLGQREGGGGRYWRRDRPGEGGRRRGQCT